MERPEKFRSRIFNSTSPAASAIAAFLFVLLLALEASPGAQAQSFRVIHNFQGRPDGATPYGTLAIDGAGNLYGTTYGGGDSGNGIVYQLTPQGSNWAFQTLYSFQGGGDGALPVSGVTVGPDGSLYGTTNFGGSGGDEQCGIWGCGTVFAIIPSGGSWQESVIHRFGGWDGAHPTGVLTLDQAGNVYGTAPYGGAYAGVVFELSSSGSGWTEKLLASFGDARNTQPQPGGLPDSGVIFDRQGNLYGVTPSDSNTDCGTVFMLTHSGSSWTRTVLHDFNTQGQGCDPQGGLIFDQQGNLYGTTMLISRYGGLGTAFQLVPSSGSWTMNTIWTSEGYFEGGGAGPTASMVMDAAGNLYGTSYAGGDYGRGAVFKLTPSSGGWIYTALHNFTGGSDGDLIQAGLVFDANGNLYGAASYGGQYGAGTVFEITP